MAVSSPALQARRVSYVYFSAALSLKSPINPNNAGALLYNIWFLAEGYGVKWYSEIWEGGSVQTDPSFMNFQCKQIEPGITIIPMPSL